MKTKLHSHDIEKLRLQISGLKRQLTDWKNGDLSLTGVEYDDLHTELAEITRKITSECTHDRAVIQKGSWTDSGYGCDRHWTAHNIYCEDCERTILDGGAEPDTVRSICKPAPIDDIIAGFVFQYEPNTSDEKLAALGYGDRNYREKTLVKYET